MPFSRRTRRFLVLPALVAGAGLFLAACGSSAPPRRSHASTPATAASSPSTTKDTAATIKENWEAFFRASTPTSKRIALLQDGSQFASLIAAQAHSSLASAASATVSRVSNLTSKQADVTYTVDLSGSPALKDQQGTAVYQDGTWKVGVKSFCSLLELEKSSGLVKVGSLPAACSSAG